MVEPADVTWFAIKATKPVFDALWKNLPESEYIASRNALRKMLCHYFGADGGDCSKALHKSISPLGGCGPGRKLLKVRWSVPGGGKSAGLRIAVVVDCAQRRVWVAGAWHKRVEPPDAVFTAAAAMVPPDS